MIIAESSIPNNDKVPKSFRGQRYKGPPNQARRPFEKSPAKMSMFRAKKLDLGCFINTRIIRDHTKRKVFEENEPER